MAAPKMGRAAGTLVPTVGNMDVTFTKAAGRRYIIKVVRSVGAELAARNGPGYDPYLPHDLVHFVVEAEAGIRGGVFGRLATGDSGLFWPVDQRELRRRTRHKRVPTPAERADMARSEWLAGISPRVWAQRARIPADLPDGVDRAVIERICTRLGEVAERWHALPADGSMTLTWPYDEGPRKPPNTPRRRPATSRAITASVRGRR